MTRLAGVLGCCLFVLSIPAMSQANCFNPLENPSFETTLIPGQNEYDQIPDWTFAGGMRAVVYGSPGSLSATSVGGSTYLDGGFSDLAIATQRIEIPQECESIYDEGYYWLLVEARFGDVVGEPDQAGVEVRFMNASDEPLGSPLQMGFNPGGGGNLISYLFVGGQRIPPGTRVVEVRVLLENVNGGRNTAWADSFFAGLTWPDPVQTTTWGGIKARLDR